MIVASLDVSVENEIQPLYENLLTFINVNSPIDLEKLIDVY